MANSIPLKRTFPYRLTLFMNHATTLKACHWMIRQVWLTVLHQRETKLVHAL
jgi:hypothetical protein